MNLFPHFKQVISALTQNCVDRIHRRLKDMNVGISDTKCILGCNYYE